MNIEMIVTRIPRPSWDPDDFHIISKNFRLLSEYCYYRELKLRAEGRGDGYEASACAKHMMYCYDDMAPWAQELAQQL